MDADFPSRKALCLWPMLVVAVALPTLALAQAEPPVPTPTPADPLAGIPVQVLDQQQVEVGTHKITYQRIVPPVFPAPAPAPTPSSATPETHAANHPPPSRNAAAPSPQPSDATDNGQKPYKAVFLSATVYDHQFTEVRWSGGSGPALRAYVNVDFNYFRGVDQIESADAFYLIFFGLGDETAGSLLQEGRQPPDLATFPPGCSSYRIVGGDAAGHPDELAVLEALCAYYDANRPAMIAAYQQREADNAARQQWLRDHPPVQPDTVIHYWPLKSRAYLPASH